MSKKIIYNKHLEKGRFYIHSDRNGGHPALLFKKNDKKNQYHVILFTSKPGEKRTRLKHSIEPNRVKASYVHNLPSMVKRRELGKKVLAGLRIQKEDKPIIELIKRKK